MTTIYKCDKCKKTIKDSNKGISIRISDYSNLLGDNFWLNYELCAKCAKGNIKQIKKLLPAKKFKK